MQNVDLIVDINRCYPLSPGIKVKILWEGYIIWKNLPRFDVYSVASKQVKDFSKNWVTFSENLELY